MTLSLRHTLRSVARALVPGLFLGALVVSGCSSSNPGPDPVSSFDATASGALSGNYAGRAAYALVPGSGTAFAVGLTSGPEDENSFMLIGRGLPEERSYDVSARRGADGAALYAVQTPGGKDVVYVATAGSITVTDKSAHHVSGRFDIVATNPLDRTDTVTLSGTFEARQGQVTAIDADVDAARS